MLTVVLATAVLSGCASAIQKAETDPTILTSSVGTSARPVDRESASDEVTIRNAVSSAYLEEIAAGRIPWVNLDTGSRGEITRVTEYEERGSRCRRFSATVESFRGVGLYSGDACLAPGGNWFMRSFVPA